MINGDAGPQSLRNAFRVLNGEVRRMEKVARRHRRQGYMKSPRQYCSVCAKVFDIAVVDPEANMTASLCSDCKQSLAQGYTAVITTDEYALMKSDYLKANGMSGKVVTVSNDAMQAIKEKYVSRKKSTDPA